MRAVCRATSRTVALLLAAFAAACGESGGPVAASPPGPNVPAPAAPGGTKPAVQQQPTLEMPKFPPLTADAARQILHAQLGRLAGDDESRRVLRYLADLGDRAGVNALHEKLLVVSGGKYEDLQAAAVGAEAAAAYGEPGAGALVLKVAGAYAAEEEDPDEYLIHALGRVSGAEGAAAAAALVKIAEGEDEDTVALAVAELAQAAAPGARDVFVRLAANAKLGGVVRGGAVAGLLRLADARGKTLADALVADALKSDSPDAPEPEDVITGLGVEGAVEASPYVRKMLDLVLAADDATTMNSATAMPGALIHIHAKNGGAELVPWLREIAMKDDGFHEDEAALALCALGDEASSAAVAGQLRDQIARWATPVSMDSAIEILDLVARRGIAAAEPFRPIVDSAAQITAGDGKTQPVNNGVLEVNLAAAHALLKSAPK